MIRGIGCDVVNVKRIRRLLDSHFASRFLEKAFHKEEILECTDSNGKVRAEQIASRWAAKEATFKAIRLDSFTPKFKEIRVGKEGKIPCIILEGETLEVSKMQNIGKLHLSISHESEVAFATVICENST